MKKVSYAKVKKAHDKYPPYLVENFFFKYFSEVILPKDKWLKNTYISIEILLFTWGFVLITLDKSPKIPIFIFTGLLLGLFIPLFINKLLYKYRIKHILKETGLDELEYTRLLIMYDE